MATKTSVEEYVDKELTGATVNDNGKVVNVALSSVAAGKLDDTSVKRDWVITGASNANVSLIATGSGNDELNLTGSIGGASVNVGSGKDSVIIGTDFVNTSLVGGEGDKTVLITGDLDPSYISLSGSNVNGTGNDSISVGGAVLDSTIDAGAGRDTIQIRGDVKNSIIRAGVDNDSVSIGGAVDASTIDLGAGRDSLVITGAVKDSTIDGGDGFDAITIGGASNTKISLGAGKDSLEVTADISDTSIYGGADADEVTLTGATYSYVDLGDGADGITLNAGTTAYNDVSIALGAGKDTIDARAITGKVSITDYDVLNDVVVGTPVGYNANGDVSLTAGGAVNISKTGEYYAVNTSGSGYYAWGDEDGSWIDLSSFNHSVTVNGSINGDVADTIVGSKKVDSIVAGDNDYVYGAGGNDNIDLTTASATTQEFVGLADAAGRDTVTGFTVTGLDGAVVAASDEADVLYAFGTSINNVKLDTVTGGTGFVAKVGTGSVQVNTAAISNDVDVNIKDNSGRVYDVDFVVGTASVTGSTDDFADVYYAGTSAASLNFSSVDSDLVVDLGNRKLTVNGTELDNTNSAVYYGKFASVTGGKDNTVLMGAADVKETLVAGAGDTTLWGGGSKSDYMQHTGTTNTATFFFTSGDGKDTISSNNWAASETSDVLWLGSTAIKSVKNSGGNTTVTLDDGSKVTLSGLSATDTAFKFSTDGVNTQQVKVGTSGSNTWTYDEGVTYYMGGTKNTLNVSDDANIWLDGSNGKAFQNVTTVNAASSSGTVILAGTAANETLIAGTGESSLWGGAGNDVLQGNNTGSTTFYFGNGNGKDVITASNSDDKVVLYNANLTDVKSADVTKSGAMEIQLKDGSSLTVNGISSGASTFQLADGSTWKYDSSEGWKQA